MSTLPIQVGIDILEDLEDQQFTGQEAQQLTGDVWVSLMSAMIIGVMVKMITKFTKEFH